MKKYTLLIIFLVFQQLISLPVFSQNNGNVLLLNNENSLPGRELVDLKYEKSINQTVKTPTKTLGHLAVNPYLSSGYTPATLVQNVLVSGCLVASNITYTGDTAALGSFNANGSNFALDNGIIIATGKVTNAVGPNQFTNASTQFTTPGDADLNVITGSNSTRDAAVLEFDFVPANNTVEFRYVFASEEYPEWACANFNDVFAFLLSGPGIIGGQGFNNDAKNIALLPNNITPVTTNNIHVGGWNQGINETTHDSLTCPDMNPQFYVSNLGSTNIEYDGMTTVLSAQWTVIPCQTYHIKFAIADVADRKWDSGVFIEGQSFTSNPVTMVNLNSNGNQIDDVIEGCNYNFDFSRNNPNNANALTIYYSITGTANGFDHTFPSDSVIIPAGIDSILVPYSIIFDSIPEGTETLTISIGNGCPCSANAILKTLTLYDALTLTTTNNSITCNGSNNGVITASATGGSGNYQYSINEGSFQSSNVFSNLGPGTYSIAVDDGISCTTIVDIVNISEPPILAVNNTTNSNISCYNGIDGMISTSATGGTGNYLYNIDGGPNQLTGIFSGLIAGDHILIVTDSLGCTAIDTITIAQPSQLSTTITSSEGASCNRFFDGSAIVSASGGTPGYSYLWSNGVTLPDNNYIGADTYFVTVTDNNGCTATNSTIISEPPLLTATITNITNVTCNGGNNGSATVIGGGGTPPYSYLWSTGDTNTTVTDLAAGTYHVTITDDHGCIISSNIIITQPLLIIPNISVITPILCNGGNNGSVSVSSTGGVSPYSYNWSNGSIQTTLAGLLSGTYTVTVTDNSGCTVSTSITLNEPLTLTASINSTNISCFGQINGSVTVTANGGTVPYSYHWSNGSTLNTINNLTIGTYSVTVNDINGCSTSVSINITQPTVLTTTITPPINVSCNNGNNGSATVVPTGGTSPYSYNWSNGNHNDTASGLSSGTYTVTVSDANGCTSTNSVVINQPILLTTMISSILNITCNGNTNGSATITANGGTPPYTYNWSNGSINSSINNLSIGTYTVTVTDDNGCTATNSVTITQPNVLNVSISPTNITCNSSNNGSATAVANGGTQPYNYNWSNGNLTQTINNLSPGTYTVTVTDFNGCTASASVAITQPNVLSTSISPNSNVTCFNGNNGSATVVANGGTSPYFYNWSNGSNNATASGLITGTYTVTVSDNNGCTSTNSITINQPLQLITNISSSINVSCNGGANGTATVIANGGIPPYSYNWSNGTINPSIINVTAGNYIVTVTDNNGCTATNSVTILQPNVINISLSSTDVTCNSGNNGSITAGVTGGTPPYLYNWSNGNSSNPITNLSIGTYTVTVTDNNGCTASSTKIISQPLLLASSISLSTNVSCFNGNNGTATITPSGGTIPYSYTWSNGSHNAINSGLATGTYTVTVSDFYGCTATNSVFISQPTQLSSSITAVSNVSCNNGNNGAVSVIANGGTSPYSYLWSNGTTLNINNNLVAGSYAVTITDTNGCITTNTVSITQPAVLNSFISSSGNVTCFGGNNGSATVSASGGTNPYFYNWSNGSQNTTASSLTIGNFTVTVSDTNGCNTTSSVIITQPSALTAITSVINNVSCFAGNDGSADVVANGGVSPYTYLWSNGMQTTNINNVAAGIYAISVTDSNGCISTSNVTINQPPQSFFININLTHVSCSGGNNGSASANITGGTGPYALLWSTGDSIASISNLVAGNYTLTVTDIFGCSLTSVVTINAPDILSATITSTDVSCFNGNNGSVGVAVIGGTSPYSFLWSNGNTNPAILGLTEGIYSITITDSNGCSDSASAVISQPTLLTSTTSSIDATCNGGNNGSATISVTGGELPYNYSWSNFANTAIVSGLFAGNYSYTVTDNNQCLTMGSITINEPTLLTSQIINFTNPTCFGYNNGNATILASGGAPSYNYLWDTGDTTTFCNNLNAGIHIVIVTDSFGCTTQSSLNISQPAKVLISTYGDATLCQGNTATIGANASGGTAPYIYTWDPPAGNTNTQTFIVFDTTNYHVFATDSNGCNSDTGIIVLNINPVLEVNIGGDSSICIGDSTTLTINISGGVGPYTYKWSSNLGTQITTISVSPTVNTTYWVTVTDACNSIPSVDSITVYVHGFPHANIGATNLKGCGSLTTSFFDNNHANNYTYYWDFGDPQAGNDNHSTDKNPAHLYNQVGVYNLAVTVTSEFGCSSSYIYPQLLAVYDKPKASFEVDKLAISLDNPIIRFTDQSFDAMNWSWDFGEPTSGSLNNSLVRNPYHEYSEIGTHSIQLYIENAQGCSDSITKEIRVLDYNTFYAPNAFTPNGDGLNDEFLVKGSGLSSEGFKMNIYNRWGELVFESNDINKGWDGFVKKNLKVSPNGIYTWIVTAQDELGRNNNFTGNIMILQ